MKRRIRTAPGWTRRLAALLCALTLVLSLSPAALAADLFPPMMEDISQYPFPLGADDYTWESYNLGNNYNEVSITSFLYANEKGGLTRVEHMGTDLIVEEFDSTYRMLSHRYLTNVSRGFCGFYAGKDYNFLARASVKEDGNAAICVDKYSKDWKLLQTGTIQDVNTRSVGGAYDFTEKNGMLFIHGDHIMSDGAARGHQSNVSLTVRISDMVVVDSFHKMSNSTYVSHSLDGWHILADQEDNVVMFEVGDGYPRAPVFHRLNGYAASVDHAAKVDRATLFDIPGALGDNNTGVVASGLEETRNYYVLAYRADCALPDALVPWGPGDNYLAFISKSDLSVRTVKLDTPASGADNAFPNLVSNGLDGGYVIWQNRSYENDRIGDGEVCFAAYSDGGVGPVQNLGRCAMSGCRPILYNGRLVWYCTRYSAPVFYGADTTGLRELNASVTSPGNLGGSVVKPAAPPAAPSVPTAPTAGGFRDVPASSPYAEGVVWAAEKGITSGKSAGVFAPGEECTNGQILTFLWRAAGSPEPGIENPFVDEIPASFQKAALWAHEKGLVSGTVFGAGIPCTRAMTVDYLWKAAGSPAVSGGASFSDVPASAPYAQAVAWAVEKDVTAGTGAGQFSPGASCTRGQIVTFLHRAYA